MKASQKWRHQFDSYLKTMPIYYAAPLKKSLARLGVPQLIPDQMDTCLSYSVVAYLKKLKNQAKMEYDKLVASVGQRVVICDGIKVSPRTQPSILQRKEIHNALIANDLQHLSSLRQDITDYNTFFIAIKDKSILPKLYRNPFDVTRSSLLVQIKKMRRNFRQTLAQAARLQDKEQMHTIPVQQMGNYQEHIRRQPSPLREIEKQPVRLHTFGNPFKVNKNLMIDEADDASMPGGQSSSKKRQAETPPASPGPPKRKPGPLPRNLSIRHLLSPSPSPDLTEEKLEIDLSDESEQSDIENNTDDLQIDIETPQLPLPPLLPAEDGLINDQQSADPGLPVVINLNREPGAIADNRQLRAVLVKLVKRPGKNFTAIFEQLGALEGSVQTKAQLIQEVTKEAARFKRKILVGMLDQYRQSLTQSVHPPLVTSTS